MPVIRPFLEYFVHFCCLCVRIYAKLETVGGEAARWNVYGQTNLPSCETKENSLFYPREISNLNPTLMVPMQDFVVVECSLLYRYKGMARCNEQIVKLGRFGREIKWFLFQWKWLKMCSGFCYSKSLKE